MTQLELNLFAQVELIAKIEAMDDLIILVDTDEDHPATNAIKELRAACVDKLGFDPADEAVAALQIQAQAEAFEKMLPALVEASAMLDKIADGHRYDIITWGDAKFRRTTAIKQAKGE